jgi:hypothetical protein
LPSFIFCTFSAFLKRCRWQTFLQSKRPRLALALLEKRLLFLKPSSTAKPMEDNAATDEISPLPLVA